MQSFMRLSFLSLVALSLSLAPIACDKASEDLAPPDDRDVPAQVEGEPEPEPAPGQPQPDDAEAPAPAPISDNEEESAMSVTREAFGTTPGGESVDLFTLTNSQGLKATVITYGGILRTLEVPDRDGNLADITLGFDTLEEWIEKNGPYMGALIGRYGNRIAEGQFTLDGTTYTLATNDGANHLHGGMRGYDKVVWQGEAIETDGAVGVRLHYLSTDGEEGYPGNLDITVTYLLTDANELKIQYSATTDKATPVNLTNHAYYNLAGQGTGDILGHLVTVNADHYTPVDAGLIPTGEIAPVAGTPFDFTQPKTIGQEIADVEGGYDHNFALNGEVGVMKMCARVEEPTTGRVMEIRTTEPGVQFYTGNFLDGTITGKDGKVYQQHYGFCLETQHYPDSPNQPDFPSTILRPGQTYTQETIHTFSVK